MRTLWTFGDSFTFGHGCSDKCTSDTYDEYKSYKKSEDDIWSNHLGKILNCNVKNFGKNGASNDYILNSIIQNYNSIQKNDYVVIGKTFPVRMDVPIKGEWKSALSHREIRHLKTSINRDDLSQTVYDAVLNFQYFFSNNPLYKTRQDEWFQFLYNRLVDDKKVKQCLIWSVPELVQLGEFNTIRNATNGKVKDGHFSFEGHLRFSKYIYSKMQKNIL